MAPEIVKVIFDSLAQARILELVPGGMPEPKAMVAAVFFDKIEDALARAMGPLAMVIIEDEIVALGEDRKAFPRDRLADLVERVSISIKDDSRRLQFQRVMLEAMRKS
jgi:hypothetical protein